MSSPFDTVEAAIAAVREGEMVVVVDDDDRENEGDLIMAASKATPDKVAFMIRHTSGILCTPILEDQAKRLHLDPMVARNDAPMSTAFTVSIDYKEGLTTGISAEERAATVQALTTSNVAADWILVRGGLSSQVAGRRCEWYWSCYGVSRHWPNAGSDLSRCRNRLLERCRLSS